MKTNIERDPNVFRIIAGVWPEDAEVNGNVENLENDPPRMFGLKKTTYDGWMWDVCVGINEGKILNWPSGMTATTWYKTSDQCGIRYLGREYEGYVPDFLQIWDNGYGDYIHVKILTDGTIEGWNPELCREWLMKNEEKFSSGTELLEYIGETVPEDEVPPDRTFEWKVRFINNIESNGLDCWYTVQKLRDFWKLYKIVPQFPADENGVVTDGKNPEYYILFEGNAKPHEKDSDPFGCSNYGEYEQDGYPSLIHVFKTLEEAQKRAVLQYDVIKAIGDTYFPEETAKTGDTP